MKTLIKSIQGIRREDEEYRKIINTAGEILRKGGLVAFPTETVYGLGADATSESASKKIYRAKGRPSDNPLIVHLSQIEDLKKTAIAIPAKVYVLARRFWPGPLTLILKKSDLIPRETTGGLDTVAVRIPESEAARDIIAAGGGFIAAPSANTSGRPSPTLVAHVIEDMSGKADMIIDGGDSKIGLESTILDVTTDPPVILRPGAITRDMLEEVVGEVAGYKTSPFAEEGGIPKAPGMKYRHYAPKAKLVIVEGDGDSVVREVNRQSLQNKKEGKRTGVMASSELCPGYRADVIKVVGPKNKDDAAAGALYKILREFDKEDIDIIYSEAFGAEGMGEAVRNRLIKASGYSVIHVGKTGQGGTGAWEKS